MADSRFFPAPPEATLAEIAERIGARLERGDGAARIRGPAPLDTAGPADLAFLDNARYLSSLAATRAGACVCAPRHAGAVPPGTAVLAAPEPHRAYVRYLVWAYPSALRPAGALGESAGGVSPRAFVDEAARLEAGVTVEPGAVIGPGVEIGSGTIIGANAVIARGVAIGRDCVIGPNVTVQCALLGNRVILHPGARIGQDGFGFSPGAAGHAKVPQVGRVIIQDDVEIGANTTIDRGANRDTVIGEGTKIDNCVHIAHNVEVGRHCLIVAQVGLSGSSRLGDHVAIGGQSGVNGHVSVGDGAQIAAVSAVQFDVPPGARWGGVPAHDVKEWFREQALIRKLARPGGARKKGAVTDEEG